MIKWNVYQVWRDNEELKTLVKETKPSLEKLYEKIKKIEQIPNLPEYIRQPLASFRYAIDGFLEKANYYTERIEKKLPKDELNQQKAKYEFYRDIYNDEAKVQEAMNSKLGALEIKLPEPEQRQAQLSFFGEAVPIKDNKTEKKKSEPEYKRYEPSELEVQLEQAELELWEKIAEVPCPKCGECGIEGEPVGLSEVAYFCSSCEEEIDRVWLMNQIPQEIREKVNRLYEEIEKEG